MDGKTAMVMLNKLYWTTREAGEPLGDLFFHMHPDIQRELEIEYILVTGSSPTAGFNDFMGVPFHISEHCQPNSIILAPIDEDQSHSFGSARARENK